MTQVRDAAQILHYHIQELHEIDAISIEEKQRLQDEIRILQQDIEGHYDNIDDTQT